MDVDRECRCVVGRVASELVNLGTAGHVNAEAGYGAWPRGLDIYWSLRHAAPADACATPRAGCVQLERVRMHGFLVHRRTHSIRCSGKVCLLNSSVRALS